MCLVEGYVLAEQGQLPFSFPEAQHGDAEDDDDDDDDDGDDDDEDDEDDEDDDEDDGDDGDDDEHEQGDDEEQHCFFSFEFDEQQAPLTGDLMSILSIISSPPSSGSPALPFAFLRHLVSVGSNPPSLAP